jgi:nicotinic acid phosphoribosyltransferase
VFRIDDDNAAVLTDLYELTMLESYFAHGMNDTAVFDLFVRRLPPTRNYLVACGLENVLHYLTFSFSTQHLASLFRAWGGPVSEKERCLPDSLRRQA